jgi:hypothetical protein
MMRYVAAAFRNIGDTPFFVLKLFAWCAIVGIAGPATLLVSGLSVPVATLLMIPLGGIGLAPLLLLKPWLLKYYTTRGRDNTVLDWYLIRLIAAGVIYQVLVGVATLFFVLPGFYVMFRLLSYLPRVARGDEVMDALEASWDDGRGEVLARFVQGVVYGLLSHLVVAVFVVPGVLWLSRVSTSGAVPLEIVVVFAGVGGVAAFCINAVAMTAFLSGSLHVVDS